MNRKHLPESVKRSVIRRVVDGEWSVREAAEAVGFSEQSVRRWIAEAPVEGPTEDTVAAAVEETLGLDKPTREVLEDVITRLPHLRCRSLQDYVRRHYRLELPRKVLSAFLREKGLTAPPVSTPGDTEPRRFEAPAPLDLVQVDLFYIRRKSGGFFYGLSVLDDHSRMALGIPVLTTQTGEAVLAAFHSVVQAWRPPGRVLTDRGPQFVSWHGRTAFQDYVEDELWATHIVAATQHPQTLGKVERFHGTLRKEALKKPEGYETQEEVQRVLDHYIAWYNYVRPHQSLAKLTPAERFFGMRRPLAESVGPRGWQSACATYVLLNLGGRRLVIAGEGPDRLKVLWDDDRAAKADGESLTEEQ